MDFIYPFIDLCCSYILIFHESHRYCAYNYGLSWIRFPFLNLLFVYLTCQNSRRTLCVIRIHLHTEYVYIKRIYMNTWRSQYLLPSKCQCSHISTIQTMKWKEHTNKNENKIYSFGKAILLRKWQRSKWQRQSIYM